MAQEEVISQPPPPSQPQEQQPPQQEQTPKKPNHHDHNNQHLIRKIINLPEKEFWKLVSVRLNTPLSKNQITEGKILPDITERELWTEEYLVEEIFLRLALTKQIIKHHHIEVDGSTTAKEAIANCCYGFTTYKYYNQARILRQWIPRARPAPKFIIDASDLTIRLIIELKSLGEDGAQQYVLKEAVGRIFENIGARQYHLSIARNLEVVLKS
jgi:hypothetical protein